MISVLFLPLKGLRFHLSIRTRFEKIKIYFFKARYARLVSYLIYIYILMTLYNKFHDDINNLITH